MEHYSNVVKAMIARSNARAADIADKIQARAYYQFQYVPPAGPLPGWSMEQQTEDAINEIGNIAYSSDEIAREAREIAQQAYNAAQAAIEMATNALTAAQNAQQTADTALNTANTAVTKADNAQASADAAQQAADAAQKSANDAQTSADNAQSTANTAIENVSQALSAANEAKASADQSNQRLDVLEPIVDTLRWYENVTDNIDFNTRVELERAFLQGTANTNGPVAGPGWLDVDDDYNETYIRQKFIAQADGACYVRFGTIVPDSSPIEVSSWTGWVKYALDTDLSGYAQLNSANTFTAANTFNSNIVVRTATAAGSSGIITLGEKPSDNTEQCLINAAGNGNLILQASENGIVGLQSGSVPQWSVASDEANTKTSAYLHSTLAATYTPATGVVWEGNAKTATKLATARTINGVAFDGTKDITIDIPEPVIKNITTNQGVITFTKNDDTTTQVDNIKKLYPATLGEGVDLNTLTESGAYFARSNAEVANYLNCPIKKAFFLEVQTTPEGNFVYQFLTQYNDSTVDAGKQYTRAYYNGNWSVWSAVNEVADIDNLVASVTESGGTLTVTKANGVANTISQILKALQDGNGNNIANTYATKTDMNTKAPLNSPTFTGSPNATTPSSSDNSTRIATTAFVKALVGTAINGGIVSANLEQNGYVKFANGLILQWGYVKSLIVTFPIQFNIIYTVLGNAHGSNNSNNDHYFLGSFSTTGASFHYFNMNFTGVSWIAIGC